MIIIFSSELSLLSDDADRVEVAASCNTEKIFGKLLAAELLSKAESVESVERDETATKNVKNERKEERKNKLLGKLNE